MKIKILSALLVLIMAVSMLGMLASCNKDGGGNTDGGGSGDGSTPGGDGEVAKTPWKQTDIRIQLTNNSNSSELTSGCRRYYAGADTSAFLEIDTNVRTRNTLAWRDANVKVTWSWIEDSDSNKGWGGNIQDMVKDVTSGSQSAPDVYCNFAYDMTCAALRGCFSNLLKEDYEYGNYFLFTEDNYVSDLAAAEAAAGDEGGLMNSALGKGYFYRYMESLSLTPETQIYCLASDFTIDMVRAFLVVPVNVELMGQIKVDQSAAGDRNGDNAHDIRDFYELVWDNGWDYTALAKYSNAIYQAGSQGPATTDISDNRIGFALGRGSGLSSSGMLYTTSVKILEKQADGTFKYPETNDKLNSFATTLRDLFVKNASLGVCVVTSAEVKAIEPDAKTELDGIRIRFAKNNVLFGGVIMVGSLEDKVYQDMRSNGQGFGIVPVPLFNGYNPETGDEYKTLVHSIARIMAISKASSNFAQCSKYLDYQSQNSADILEAYYTEQLGSAVAGGIAGEDNIRMLNYIRNHVNDCFDKTYEDAIANYMGETDPNAVSTRWHGMLMNNNYQMSSFSTVYESVLDQKQIFIKQVYEAWLSLEKAK